MMRTKSIVQAFAPLTIPAQNLQITGAVIKTVFANFHVQEPSGFAPSRFISFSFPIIVDVVESQKSKNRFATAITRTAIPIQNFFFPSQSVNPRLFVCYANTGFAVFSSKLSTTLHTPIHSPAVDKRMVGRFSNFTVRANSISSFHGEKK